MSRQTHRSNTAVSFVTNTTGRVTRVKPHELPDADAGAECAELRICPPVLAVAIALIRGLARHSMQTIYINDHEMALSIAKEKKHKTAGSGTSRKIAVKAGLPKHMVVETALETAERTVHAWSEMAPNLPLQNHAREQIDEQLRQVPLSAHFSLEHSQAFRETAREKKEPKGPNASPLTHPP